MARPRTHDLDQLLDVAERLVADGGPERFTVRALAEASGVSNGAIYHAFGSLPVLLGRLWMRAAGEFLDLQVELVDAVQGGDRETAIAAVVAAAGAPAVFADRRPAAVRMLMAVRRDQLLGPQVPDELAEEMFALDQRLVALLVRLARGLWGRADGASVEVITLCVVDLPTAVFRRALTEPSADGRPVIGSDSRERLEAAVRGALTLPPPPPRNRRPKPSEED
ncbi:helix-turn-helix domain-containing protein [Nonomuraea sp. NPDC049141]|uniref:helix-turn-helix domain-containing protein n=1 Tax=unclassified Nonomuraea TaxID=2593643 RepID=UPI00340B99CC